MEKSKVIEKLFSYFLESSYLLLPVVFLLGKSRKNSQALIIGIYGIIVFFFLHFYYDLPKSFRKTQQAFFTATEFSVFTYIIWYNSQSAKLKNTILRIAAFFYLFLIFYFLISKPQKVDSIPVGIEAILIFIFSTMLFSHFLKYNLKSNIYEYSSFWLVVAIIIYLAAGFFFNILANEVTQDQIKEYWHYTFIPEILKNLVFALVISGLLFKPSEISTQIKKPDIPNLDMI